MRRIGRAGLLAALTLVLAPAAAHAVPVPTLSTALSPAATPSLLSAMETPKNGGPTTIADGFGLNKPTLQLAPGGAVTIVLDKPVDVIRAYFEAQQLTLVATGEHTYTA